MAVEVRHAKYSCRPTEKKSYVEILRTAFVQDSLISLVVCSEGVL